MGQWRKASDSSTYAAEVNCTRCGTPYVKEVKSGDSTAQRKRNRWDTAGMCNGCTRVINFQMGAVAVGIAIPVTILLMVFA